MGKKQRMVQCPHCGGQNPKKLTAKEKRVNFLFNALCLNLQQNMAKAGKPMSFSQVQDAMGPLVLDLLNSNWQDYDNLPFPVWFDEREGRLKWTFNGSDRRQNASQSGKRGQ